MPLQGNIQCNMTSRRLGAGVVLDNTVAYVDTGALGSGTLGDAGDPFPTYVAAVTALNAEHSGSPVPVTIVFTQDLAANLDLDLFAVGLTDITFSGAAQTASIVTAQAEVSWTLTVNITVPGIDASSTSTSPGSLTVNGTGTIGYVDGSGDNGANGSLGASDDQSGVDGADGYFGNVDGQAGTSAAGNAGGAVGGNGSVGFAGRTLIYGGALTLAGLHNAGGGNGGVGGDGGAAFANGGHGGSAYDDGSTPANGGNGGDAANATGGDAGAGASGGDGGDITIGSGVDHSGASFNANGGALGAGGSGGLAYADKGLGGTSYQGGTPGSDGANGVATNGAGGGAGASNGSNGTITYL